jgi:hypothetical protein|tara:strand:+ start:9664 stop:10599 length:936 start_codon:yes stop_codon:yes gene_type:complete
MNELIISGTNLPDNFKDFNQDMLKDITGQTEGSGNLLPSLKIEYKPEYFDEEAQKAAEKAEEDYEPVRLPLGSYKITVRDEDDALVTVYDKAPVFRPYIHTHRFSVFDSDAMAGKAQSTHFKTWDEVVLDDLGGEYAGKTYKRKFTEDHARLLSGEKMRLQCSHVLWGTVTFPNGKDMFKNKTELVTDIPCMFYVKGASFMTMVNMLKEFSEQGLLLFSRDVKLSVERIVNGEVTYYPVKYAVQKAELPFAEDEFGLLKQFQATIDAENQDIYAKFEKKQNALKADAVAKDVSSAPLDADLDDVSDDKIPF